MEILLNWAEILGLTLAHAEACAVGVLYTESLVIDWHGEGPRTFSG